MSALPLGHDDASDMGVEAGMEAADLRLVTDDDDDFGRGAPNGEDAPVSMTDEGRE